MFTLLKIVREFKMPIRLLIASLGNPAPYTNTFHSAGHALLDALRLALSFPPFAHDRSIGNGFVSRDPISLTYTLWQSPSLMNVSGKGVAAAYKSFLRELPSDERATARLVVLHDELEQPLGKIKMKVGGSAKGHNGIKSVMWSLGGAEFIKIGVGIGRPESRDSAAVANYVLKRMTAAEMMRVKNGVGEVLVLLERMINEG